MTTRWWFWISVRKKQEPEPAEPQPEPEPEPASGPGVCVCSVLSVLGLGRGMGEEKGGGLCHESVRLQEARVARVKLEGGFPWFPLPFPFPCPFSRRVEQLQGVCPNSNSKQPPPQRTRMPGTDPTALPALDEHPGVLRLRNRYSVVSRLSSVAAREGEKRWRINWGPTEIKRRHSRLFFILAIGLASLALMSEERAGGDRRGRESMEGFLWRRGTLE
ncbi:hypothetical protein QBC39DRAFT_15895 [Podospora conica]|nr:hypothetical protein QBC39DRAFT_15895 [Schizothecium conicum]